MKECPFASRLSQRGHFYSEAGSHMHPIYEMQLDERGHKVLIQTGERDIYEEIQSYYEDTKIENIIAKCAAGDKDILNQRQGVYADITETPKNLMEAQNTIIKLQAEFDKLPVKIKEKFDNSKERFISMFGSDEFMQILGFKTEKQEKTENVTFDGQKVEEPLTPEVGNE